MSKKQLDDLEKNPSLIMVVDSWCERSPLVAIICKQDTAYACPLLNYIYIWLVEINENKKKEKIIVIIMITFYYI